MYGNCLQARLALPSIGSGARYSWYCAFKPALPTQMGHTPSGEGAGQTLMAPYEENHGFMFDYDGQQVEETHKKCLTENLDCEILLLSPYALLKKRLQVGSRDCAYFRFSRIRIRDKKSIGRQSFFIRPFGWSTFA